ncbi:MAG: ribonuclease III [Chloroflexota bacterium]
MPDLTSLEQTIGVTFKNPALLRQALTHDSYTNENPAFLSNERLEFLGDAILGFVIAERLYQKQEDAGEGELTRMRAGIISRESLARVAETLSLGDYLFLGKGEADSGGRHKGANLAGALESLIAAVFLDRGLEVARELVVRLFGEALSRGREESDYKSRLQELVQAQGEAAPAYRLVSTDGPDHARLFTVEVVVGDRVLAWGVGKSKKSAETEAAREALVKLRTGTV